MHVVALVYFVVLLVLLSVTVRSRPRKSKKSAKQSTQSVENLTSFPVRKWLRNPNKPPLEIMMQMQSLMNLGRVADVVEFCAEVEDEFGTLAIVNMTKDIPSIFSYKGVALYQMQRMQDAENAFLDSVRHFPNDSRSWVNIGEIRVQTFRLTEAIEALEKAYALGELSTVPRLVRAKGWSLDFRNIDLFSSELEKLARECFESNRTQCLIDSSGGFEYTDTTGEEQLVMQKVSPHASVGTIPIDKSLLASYWPVQEFGLTQRSSRRLRVGFVSSDFGVHPVSSLIRGMFQEFDRSKFEVFCFALTSKLSFWGTNISGSVDHFYVLPATNLRDGAEMIASCRIEILIDLNGHTLNSGLNLLSYRPSPMQMTYLGLPTSSGSAFVDYFIGDHVASPPEHRNHFSESLILMNPCYIANDYALLQGDLLQNGQQPRHVFLPDAQPRRRLEEATILLGTLSNSMKIDQSTLLTMLNIMRRFAGSQMVFVQYAGNSTYVPNLKRESLAQGIDSFRIHHREQIPWIDHLDMKSAIDLMLDTKAKNGHTTGLDGVWAGVPTLTFGGGKDMQARAGESIAHALNSNIGVSFSYKDYEDMAVALLKDKHQLRKDRSVKRRNAMAKNIHNKLAAADSIDHSTGDLQEKNSRESTKFSISQRTGVSRSPKKSSGSITEWSFNQGGDRVIGPISRASRLATAPEFTHLKPWRQQVERLRNSSYLFDTRSWTRSFERLLEATWEAYHISSRNGKKPFHIVAQSVEHDYAKSGKVVRTGQVFSHGSEFHNRPGMNMEDTAQAAIVNNAITVSNEGAALLIRTKSVEQDQQDAFQAALDLDKLELDNGDDSETATASAPDTNNKKPKKSKLYPPIPKYVFDGRLVLLNIGGTRRAEGWLNVNAQYKNYKTTNIIDINREMHDLQGMPNNSVSALYSSHTLEHAPYGNGMLNKTLSEWHRVIRPGGLLLISVPDMENIARIFLDSNSTIKDRWYLMNVIFGGQQNALDFHYFGYTTELLAFFLQEFGFCGIKRVGPFNLDFHDEFGKFADSSDIVVKGYLLSLNIVARVCPESKPSVKYDDFAIQDNAIPYLGHRVADYPGDVIEKFFQYEGKMVY